MRRLAVPVLIAFLLLPLAIVASADGPRPVFLLTAEFTERGVRVAADTNLPAGSRVDLLLQHRGRTLISARRLSEGGRIEATLALPRPLPPSYYDVAAVWVPQYQATAAPTTDPPVVATISIAHGTREEILKHRNQERAFHADLLAELGRQFTYLHEELSLAVRDVRDPSDPSFLARLRASQALFVSQRNELLERERRNGLALLGEAQFLTRDLIDYVLAVHGELIPAPGAEPAIRRLPLVLDADFLGQLERGFGARREAVDRVLARERDLGDADLLVHTLRTVGRLRGILVLARSQESLAASETGWRSLAGPLEDDLLKTEDACRILVESARGSPGFESFVAFGRLTADLRRLWEEVGSVVLGHKPSWKAFDEIEKSVREEFARVVEPLGLDYVRMGP